VVVEFAACHKHQGKEFVVSLSIRVPGGEISVSHDHDENVMSALQQAFSAAKRMLEERIRRQRRTRERARSAARESAFS